MSRYEAFRDYLAENQYKFILSFGAILIAFISFIAGRVSHNITSEEEIEIVNNEKAAENTEGAEVINSSREAEGKYVGDVNGNIYYATNSLEASKIKDENVIWFENVEDAADQGYETGSASAKSENSTGDGAYVGSKNSDKYHMPDSGSAKRIKEENKVWFQSKEEAENEGYVPGSSVKD